MTNRIRIETTGMKGFEHDFERLSGPEPYEHARERLNVAADKIFAATQALVPEGKGDKRRPAGALRESGQLHTDHQGDFWNASIQYGTHDDRLPYAVWARWKHVGNTGVDYMSPTDDPDDLIPRAMNTAFDDVFDKGHVE